MLKMSVENSNLRPVFCPFSLHSSPTFLGQPYIFETKLLYPFSTFIFFHGTIWRHSFGVWFSFSCWLFSQKIMTNLRCPIWAPKFILKQKIRTNLPNESICTQIMKMLGAWVILEKSVALLNIFIIPPIIGIWCLIIPILGTNKAQEFKLLRTKPSSNNSFT